MSEIDWYKIQRKLEGRCHMCGGELPKHIGVCSVFGEEMMKKYQNIDKQIDEVVCMIQSELANKFNYRIGKMNKYKFLSEYCFKAKSSISFLKQW